MSNQQLFLKMMKKLYHLESLSREQKTYLEEVFAEIDAVFEPPEVIYSSYNMLFSDVEIHRVFHLGGESYCKISQTEYVHISTREKTKVAGDPVVSVTLREK
jgi:hypothetical protein